MGKKVTQTGAKPQTEIAPQLPVEQVPGGEFAITRSRDLLIECLRLLWNERRLIARTLLAGLLLGTLLALLLPKRYESSAVLMPPDSQSSSGMAMIAALTARTGNGLGAFAGDLLGLKSTGAMFVGIFRSRTVEERLVERFDLKKVYSVHLDVDARRTLAENTAISEDRKSGIITITVTDHDPKRAAAIAQAYVEELDRLVADLSTSSAHRERVFLGERLIAVKQELDQASREFSQFASKNIAIDIKEQGKAMVEAAATLQGELIAAESQLKGLEEIYTPSNVRVRSVQARISELRRQLEKLGGKVPNSGTSEPADGTPLFPSIRMLPLLGVTYADMYMRAKIQETVFETLTQQYELAKVQEAKETPSVKVLDAPAIPERRSFPPRTVVVGLCVFVAFAAASIWVLGSARWVQMDPRDPGKVFAHEVFQTLNARMPWAPPNGSRLQAFTHRVWTGFVRQGASTKESGEYPNHR
jgi:capsule polysaccharide export protein KpsE/RkpR